MSLVPVLSLSNHVILVKVTVFSSVKLFLVYLPHETFALGHGISFFGGIQHSPVDGCSAVSCNFGVLTGEDKRMSEAARGLMCTGQRGEQ